MLDRRRFLAASSAAALPFGMGGAARASDISGYYERLQRRIGDAGGGRFIAGGEDLLLGEHNGFREAHGLSALRRDPAFDAVARAHAADMLERGYFQHASPEGYTSVQRVGLLARRFVGLVGENIVDVRGGPPSTAAELAQLWRDSPGHRANMLHPSFTHVGFAVARTGDRTVGAAVFGQRYVELPEAVAFRLEDVGSVAETLSGAGAMKGFGLEPVRGGRMLGPFWLEDPAERRALAGAYAIKPYLPDPATPRRFIIVDGPIVEA